jgi:putative GTP pyrophosphokinase
VVGDLGAQEELITQLVGVFDEAEVVDRRDVPSHGYRAVHVVLRSSGRLVELQVRTALQHVWAELSEKLSDTVDPAIKYGGGPEHVQQLLATVSSVISKQEDNERGMLALLADASERRQLPDKLATEIAKARDGVDQSRRVLATYLDRVVTKLNELRGDHS